MAPSKPLTPAEKKRIRQMHSDGASRNAIAKALGRGAATITRYCQEAGLAFPSDQSTATTRARELNVRERSVAAHERQLRILELWQERMEQGLTGKGWETRVKEAQGAEHFQTVAFMPSSDFKDAQTAATSATSALKNLAPLDTGRTEQAMSVLDRLAEGFKQVAEQQDRKEGGA